MNEESLTGQRVLRHYILASMAFRFSFVALRSKVRHPFSGSFYISSELNWKNKGLRRKSRAAVS